MFKLLCVLSLGWMGMASGWARDPTRPPQWLPTEAADQAELLAEPGLPLTLSSIIIQGRSRQALLGKRWLKVGEQYDDWRLIAIEPTGVWLSRADRKFWLALVPSAIQVHTGNR